MGGITLMKRLKFTEEATMKAWNAPYTGTSAHLLKNAIETANAEGGRHYTRFFAIIQSSGMGKSRTINEVAKSMFTIPFNIRSEDNGELAYPPPDDNIRNYFDRFPVKNRLETSGYFLVFFAKLFEVIREELEAFQSWGAELPGLWYNYLSEISIDSKSNREMIYEEVIKRATAFEKEIEKVTESDNDTDGNKPRSGSEGLSSGPPFVKAQFREAATPHVLESMEALRKTIHSFRVPRSKKAPIIMMYFDECHVLSERACLVDAENRTCTMYDALTSALNVLSEFNVFTVFLSTSSSLERHAPPTTRFPSSRGELLTVHAPFTELPFDCHPDLPIFSNLQPRSRFQPLTLQKICETDFMCMFGRPLLWTRYEQLHIGLKPEFISLVEAQLRGDTSENDFTYFEPQLQTDILSANDRKNQLLKALTNAGAARFAVLDVRIMLDMDSLRQPIQKVLESQLVKSHMRVAFSVPAHREHCISGYPSEPILAEAAAQLMRKLRNNSGRVDVIPQIIAHHAQHGLIAKGERGELVARLLLTMAYDRAHESRAAALSLPVRFSDPLSVTEFLQALLGPHWEKIKKAKPDNLPSSTTLEEAFQDAKVRFTHFNRAWDDSGCTVWAAMAAFLRGMAIQCHATKEGIDIILPVFFESENPNTPREIGLQHFSGILISVKNREKARARHKVRVDATQIDFFPVPRDPQSAIRPYMVIVMELGVQGKHRNNTAVNPRKRDAPEDEDMQEAIEDPNKRSRTRPTTPISAYTVGEIITSPSNVPTQEGPECWPPRGGAQDRHPRYTIHVHGCSPSVYPVIESRSHYALLLGSRKLVEEHPRNDPESLDGLWAMKPGWSSIESKECYRWFNGSEGPDEVDVVEEGVLVGVGEGNY